MHFLLGLKAWNSLWEQTTSRAHFHVQIPPTPRVSTSDQLLNRNNTRRRRRRRHRPTTRRTHRRRRRRLHPSSPRLRPNGPSHDNPLHIISQRPIELPRTRVPRHGDEMQHALESGRELAVGAESRERRGSDDGDVVIGKGPGAAGDEAVAGGGDVVADFCLGGGEAGRGVSGGADEGAEGGDGDDGEGCSGYVVRVRAGLRWWERVDSGVDADVVGQAHCKVCGYGERKGLRDESGEAEEEREGWRHCCVWYFG